MVRIYAIILWCLLILCTVSAQAQWSSSSSDSNRGNQLYSSGGGTLGYSIRTALGGGWSWQFVDGANTSYFSVQYPTGNVGIGTTNPLAKFDVQQADPLGDQFGNFKLLTSESGRSYSWLNHNQWLYRDTQGSDQWTTARLHDGISIDFTEFAMPGQTTKTWWERDPYDNIQSWGNANTTYMTINNGYVGIGTNNPLDVLHVVKTGNNQLVLEDLSSAADGVGGGIRFMGNTSGTAGRNYFATIRGVKAPSTPGGILKIETSDNVGNSFERLRIDNSGHVGIGTTALYSRLSIKANSLSQGLVIGNVDVVGNQSHFALTTADQSGIGYASESYFNIYNDGYWHFNSGNSYGTTMPITFSTDCMPRLFIEAGGNVGIGTTTPDAKLAVKGLVHAQEVKVSVSVPGPDYVFEEDYNLLSLFETEKYIKANKHLPEVPAAKEMEANGINVSEMNMLLLKKVEELTLHLIEQQKYLQKIDEENKALKERMSVMEKNK